MILKRREGLGSIFLKIAIITITDDAYQLAEKLFKGLKNDPTVISVEIFHKGIEDAIINNFKQNQCVLGIMASGIMIRKVCPLMENKKKDPAVLVMDDKGKYVISLLSGHLGGANDLALKVAEICGAEPVITTATDVHGKMGIDSLARKYFLQIEDYKNIKAINSALVQDIRVELYVPTEYDFLFNDLRINESYLKKEWLNKEIKAVYEDRSIILSPRKMIVGIGARKGISKAKVMGALKNSIKMLGLSLERINTLATVEIKKDEQGIIKTAEDLDIPLEIVGIDHIKSLNHPHISSSKFVEEKFEIPGVCEPAALFVAGENSDLIFKKTAYDGVTIAIAVSLN